MLNQRSRSAAATPAVPRRWLALVVLLLAEFLVVLDRTTVTIALPSVGADLGMGDATLGWVITAFLLPFGGLLLLGGRLGDRFGHLRVFLAGLGAFTAASLVAGLAGSAEILFAARALQGAAAALVAPTGLALLIRLFPEPADRARALGLFGAVAGGGAAVGSLLGGVLTDALGWRAVLFVNVPVGVLVLVVVPRLVGPIRQAAVTDALDVLGAVTATGFLVALVAALGVAAQGPPLTAAGLAALAVGFAVAFVLAERRAAHPLVPIRILRDRSVLGGNVAMVLVGVASAGWFFVLSLYQQNVLGFDALTAGLGQLPAAVALVLTASVTATVTGRFGVRPTLVTALAVLAAALGWLALLTGPATGYTALLAPLVLAGASLGVVFVGVTMLATGSVDAGDGGLAAGLLKTSQQIGGGVGIALAVTVAGLVSPAVAAGAAPAALLSGGYAAATGAVAVVALLAAAVLLALRAGASPRARGR